MGKLIIKNNTNILDIDAIDLVKKIMLRGRISNNGKQFCYCSVITINNIEYTIISNLRKCSDVFTIYESKQQSK